MQKKILSLTALVLIGMASVFGTPLSATTVEETSKEEENTFVEIETQSLTHITESSSHGHYWDELGVINNRGHASWEAKNIYKSGEDQYQYTKTSGDNSGVTAVSKDTSLRYTGGVGQNTYHSMWESKK